MGIELLSGVGLGAGLSGILALLGVVYTQRRHDRRERDNWYRARRFEVIGEVIQAMTQYERAYMERDRDLALMRLDDFVTATSRLEGLGDTSLVRLYSFVCHERLRGISANMGGTDETLTLAIVVSQMTSNVLEDKPLTESQDKEFWQKLLASQQRDLPPLWPRPQLDTPASEGMNHVD